MKKSNPYLLLQSSPSNLGEGILNGLVLEVSNKESGFTTTQKGGICVSAGEEVSAVGIVRCMWQKLSDGVRRMGLEAEGNSNKAFMSTVKLNGERGPWLWDIQLVTLCG